MPTYRITDPTSGRTLKLTGDSPPNEQELEQIFSQYGGAKNTMFAPRVGGKPVQTGLYSTPTERPVDMTPAETASQLYTPLLQYGGMAGGGVLAGGAATPETVGVGTIPAAVAGGSLGYAAGGRAAKALDALLGVGQLQTLPQAFKEAGQDIITGAEYEMGGRAAMPVLGLAGKGLYAAGRGARQAGKELIGRPGTVPTTEIGQLGEKFKIPTTIGEDLSAPNVQRLETVMERVPLVGTTGFRKKQAEAAQRAAQDFLGNYIIDPTAADAAAANRAYADELYSRLNAAVEGIPKQQVVARRTGDAAKNLLERYPDVFKKFQDAKTERLIKDIVGGVEQNTPEAVSGFGAGGRVTYNVPKPRTFTFDDMWQLRKGLGEKIGQARKKLASGEIDQTTYSQMKQLFGAVDDDITAWTKEIKRPDVRRALDDANMSYRNFVVKHDIVQRAYDKAAGVSGAGEAFSPQKFATELKKSAYKAQKTQSFSQREIDEMQGLAKIMQAVKRAGQFRENVPTSDRWGALGLGGGTYLAGGLPAVAETGAAVFTLNKLLTSPAGKRIILAAKNVKPGTVQMERLVKQAVSLSEGTPVVATTAEQPVPKWAGATDRRAAQTIETQYDDLMAQARNAQPGTPEAERLAQQIDDVRLRMMQDNTELPSFRGEDIPEQGLVNGITREEAGRLAESGADGELLKHIQEGIQKHGVDKMESSMINEINDRVLVAELTGDTEKVNRLMKWADRIREIIAQHR